ncbi:MAG: hypothetical protein J6B37_02890 [Clostridia bacterium]|nr:hypothetical protein [Clostridia bacterium]
MQKIVDSVYDIIAFSNGIIYTKKTVLENGSVKVSFYGYDIKRMQNTPVTKSVYLLNKYGPEYKKIAEQLGDYVSCDAEILPSKHVVVVYNSGETGIFSPDGEMVWSSDLNYQGSEISGAVADGNQIWSVVPDKNCVVNYSISHKKFSMRIGSLQSTSFQNPVSISKYDNELFICNADSKKVRTINLKDYSVNDFRIFDEPVYKYLRSCGKEIVVLESGVYVL